MVQKEQIEKILKDIETADKLRARIEEIDNLLSGTYVDNLEAHIDLTYTNNGIRETRCIGLTKELQADFLRSVKDYYSKGLKEIEYRLGSLPEFENYKS